MIKMIKKSKLINITECLSFSSCKSNSKHVSGNNYTLDEWIVLEYAYNTERINNKSSQIDR